MPEQHSLITCTPRRPASCARCTLLIIPSRAAPDRSATPYRPFFRRARWCCASTQARHRPPSPGSPPALHRSDPDQTVTLPTSTSQPEPVPLGSVRNPPTHRSTAGLVSETRRRVLGPTCAVGNHEQQPDGCRASSVRHGSSLQRRALWRADLWLSKADTR